MLILQLGQYDEYSDKLGTKIFLDQSDQRQTWSWKFPTLMFQTQDQAESSEKSYPAPSITWTFYGRWIEPRDEQVT